MEERVELKGSYNKIVAVARFPRNQKSPCVILCHGLLSSKEGSKYLLMSERFCSLGFVTLRLDFHGCGESGGEIERTTLSIRLENLDRVLEYVSSHPLVDSKRLGLLGSSFGAVVCLVKIATDPRVSCAVLLSTPLEIKKGRVGIDLKEEFFEDLSSYDLLSAAKRSKCVLLIHGEKDEQVPVEQARTIYEYLSPPKEIHIIEGADHRFSDPSHRQTVIDLSLSWFSRFLLQP